MIKVGKSNKTENEIKRMKDVSQYERNIISCSKGRYGIGLFNAVNLELARGIIKAAEEKIHQ